VTYTSDYRRKTNRRLDRTNERRRQHRDEVDRVLRKMTAGAALRRTNRRHRVLWSLSTGEFITSEVAASVLADRRVVGVGDSLFGSELSQTFRYVEEG